MKYKSNVTSFKEKLVDSTFFVVMMSFFMTFLISILILVIKKITPFGDNTLLCVDASIQYIDFYAYLWDILHGSNSLIYTFSHGIGGTGVGIFAYYLSSPLNLLLYFFDKENLPFFYTVVTLLKWCFSSAFMSLFVRRRFERKINSSFVVLLGISYGLMQYNLAQCLNSMWLDGIYMLPLIALGVSETVRKNKGILLSISVALSILFNWYTGGINCIFSAAWFCFEYILLVIERDDKFSVKKCIRLTIQYAYLMISGILASMILFLPAILCLRGGKGSSFDWSVLHLGLRGNPLSAISGFNLGMISTDSRVSLYCGFFVLAGVIGLFCSRELSKKKKIYFGLTLISAVSIFYIQTLVGIFSLFKSVGSYFYRYSYISIFVLVFLVAYFYSERNRLNVTMLIIGVASYMIISTVCGLKYVSEDFLVNKKVWISYGLLIIQLLLIFFYTEDRAFFKLCKKHIIGLIFCIGIIDIAFSFSLQLVNNGDGFSSSQWSYYYENQKAQVEEIEEVEGNDLFRINQTQGRVVYDSFLTAYYDDAFSINYAGIAGYTSCPDNRQMAFLEKNGYRSESGIMKIVNTSVVPLDSLLGVRYILSPYEIKGLEDTSIFSFDDLRGESKKVWKNPYALPIAFIIPQNENEFGTADDQNPFLNINCLYSRLLGEEIKLFIPVDFKTVEPEKNDSYEIRWDINGVSENCVLYGNIPWQSYEHGVLNVNEKYKANYLGWESPSVFYIPTDGEKASVSFAIDTDVSRNSEVQFYALDLEEMRTVAKKINEKAVDLRKNSNSSFEIETTGNDGEGVFLSIPWNEGWKVFNNGKVTEPKKIDDCLMMIPLNSGKNLIQVKYHIPGLTMGMILSFMGILMIFGYMVRKKDNY